MQWTRGSWGGYQAAYNGTTYCITAVWVLGQDPKACPYKLEISHPQRGFRLVGTYPSQAAARVAAANQANAGG